MIQLLRPLHLLLAALTYLLGASIPAYLGTPLNATVFALGFAFVLLAQAGMALLSEVFRPHNEPLTQSDTPQKKETLRNNLLYVSIALITAAAFVVYLLYLNKAVSLPSFIFLLCSILLILLYSVPPARLLNYGFGELALAAQISYITPSIGFLLQTHEQRRLLPLLIIPLTALALAYFLINNFTTFPDDQKYFRSTLLRRLTWERAVPFHHGLIVFAYLVFASLPMLGFSFNLIWPAFLTLPFALFQIVQLQNIANGNPPNWKLLTSTALAVFGLTTYFITLTFWMR